MKRNLIFALIIGLVLALLMVSIVQANNVIYVNPGSIGSHACDDTEWHFVITQISEPSLAPASIHVVWANGAEDDLSLDRVTGGTAHYYYYGNLNVPVANAWAEIYDGWSGTFTLSHGPCISDPTPTSTSTSTLTATSTSTNVPTSTPTNTDVPTNTPTSTNIPTDTPTGTPTDDPNTPTPTSTGTQPTATSTNTPTPTSTATATYTATPSPSPTPTSSGTPEITITPTLAPTETPFPPNAAAAVAENEYPGRLISVLVIDGIEYDLYVGVKADDGSLLLPTTSKGAAYYQGTIWLHRAWNTGWVRLHEGDIVTVGSTNFVLSNRIRIPYGEYPTGSSLRIASCYSDVTGWVGVEVLELEAK